MSAPVAIAHHEVFARFPCFQGDVDEGIEVDFLGVRRRTAWWAPHKNKYPSPRREQTCYPEFKEEYFEWVDVLSAVCEARDQFTMIELGAGWGRWVVRAATALRLTGDLPCRLIAVEAEPTHFRWMREHFRDNGINPHEHLLLEAAVGPQDGHVHFATGNADSWYGQSIVRQPGAPGSPPRDGIFRRVGRLLGLGSSAVLSRHICCVSLKSLLGSLDRVDLVDADIQGSEADVFEAARAELGQKVRAVHIGTHSTEIEGRLRELFTSLGWRPRFDYSCFSHAPTPWGTIHFGDGVQSWRNPRL